MEKRIRNSLTGWLRPSYAARSSGSKHEGSGKKTPVSSSHRQDPHLRPELHLDDLDAEWTGRRSMTVRGKAVPSIKHVRRYLATRLASNNSDNSLPFTKIRLFDGHREIADNRDDVRYQAERLSYQVVLSEPSSSLPLIDFKYEGIELSESQLTHIQARINDGITCGDLQSLVQSILTENGGDDINSHHQIEIRAVGGLRSSPIQGLNWEVRRVVNRWFCQRLSIRIRSTHQHVVVKAFNQEYILSRPKVDREGTISVRSLKKWFLRRIMLHIDEDASRGGEIDLDEFTCRDSHGKILRNRSRVACGSSVELGMSRATEEKFIQSEQWLVPTSVSCMVCGDDKRPSEMPGRITKDCGHEAQTCKECVGHWIASSLESTAWDRLRCPECPRLLGFHAVAAFAERDVFIRYDALATRAAMSSIAHFKWCMNPRCDAGQLYSAGCSRAKCRSCKHSMCVHHDIPWHKGETCDQYDRRTHKQRKNDRASKKKIKTMTKPCPKCKRNVHKYTGCDHITCICGHEWCYLCFSEYARNDHGMLRCQHKQGCRYRADPPFYEGGLPFGFRGPAFPRPPGLRATPGAATHDRQPEPNWDFWGMQPQQRGGMDFRRFNL